MATPNVKSTVLKWVGGGTIGVASSLLVSHLVIHEGYSPKVYSDPIGVKTYCYGETSHPDPTKYYSKGYCQFLLSKRAVQAIKDVRANVPKSVYLSPEELAAWGSFSYNVGLLKFKSSTAYKLLRSGRRHAACRQLGRWVYGIDRRTGKAVRLNGLVARRGVEQQLCERGASNGDV